MEAWCQVFFSSIFFPFSLKFILIGSQKKIVCIPYWYYVRAGMYITTLVSNTWVVAFTTPAGWFQYVVSLIIQIWHTYTYKTNLENARMIVRIKNTRRNEHFHDQIVHYWFIPSCVFVKRKKHSDICRLDNILGQPLIKYIYGVWWSNEKKQYTMGWCGGLKNFAWPTNSSVYGLSWTKPQRSRIHT